MTPMFRIESKPESTGMVRLMLAGRMHANSLGEIRRAIDRARRYRGHRVALDLSEITLADRASVDFLVQQRNEEIELINCPLYLQPWIEGER
jgi:anti-anti-sigma regulatory factor